MVTVRRWRYGGGGGGHYGGRYSGGDPVEGPVVLICELNVAAVDPMMLCCIEPLIRISQIGFCRRAADLSNCRLQVQSADLSVASFRDGI